MKKYRVIKILILSIIFMTLITVKSYGAVAIIKEGTTFTNRNILRFL